MKKLLMGFVLRLPFVVITLLTLMIALGEAPAEARLTRIIAGPATFIDLPAFGDTGPYLKIAGTFEGELGPRRPTNTVIADIGLAPRTNGKVLYSSTFYILRPVNLGRGNHKIFYDFGNRGGKRILQWFNDGTASDDPSPRRALRQRLPDAPGLHRSLQRLGGRRDAGAQRHERQPAYRYQRERVIDYRPGAGRVGAWQSHRHHHQSAVRASSTSATNGVLTVREHQTDPEGAGGGWSYVNDRRITFPGPAQTIGFTSSSTRRRIPRSWGSGTPPPGIFSRSCGMPQRTTSATPTHWPAAGREASRRGHLLLGSLAGRTHRAGLSSTTGLTKTSKAAS